MAQTGVAMEHVAQVLAALGADLADTVKLGAWYRGDGTRATWEPAAPAKLPPLHSAGSRGKCVANAQPAARRYDPVDAWAMRDVDGRRLARTYAQLHEAWQWPVA